jgi:hypothetical protein
MMYSKAVRSYLDLLECSASLRTSRSQPSMSVDFRNLYVCLINVEIMKYVYIYIYLYTYMYICTCIMYIYIYVCRCHKIYVHLALCTCPSRMLKMCENRAIGRFCLKWISIPYEDKLMLCPYSTYCSEGEAHCESS